MPDEEQMPDIADLPTQDPTQEGPEASGAEGAPSPDTLQGLVKEKERRIAELTDRYARAFADFENYKKRMARDQIDQAKYALESFLRELLPVLDSISRALEHAAEGTDRDQWIEGVALTRKQFVDVLTKAGVSPIRSVGEPFDPAFHQAIAQKNSSEAEDGTVTEEVQKGFMLEDRVLRPAMVVVAKRSNATESVDSGDAD